MGVVKLIGVTKFVVNQFLKKNEEFAYIRRYKSDLKESTSTFFQAINSNAEFKNDLNSKGNKFFCDDHICGHAMTLSTSQDLKSSNFSNVKTIIFDEFIIDKGQKKYYLKNEVFIFLNLIETIARMRDVRVFLIGNAGSITNPYFLYLDINMPREGKIKLFKDNLILVQHMCNLEYREAKKLTKFRKTYRTVLLTQIMLLITNF